MPERPQRRPESPLTWFGKYLSLALTLPACVAAGYILALIAGQWWHSPLVKAGGIFLGMIAGILQVVRELSRDAKRP